MTTTVKLLSTYDNFPPYTILDLPDNVAAALLAGGIGATTDLTGGTRRYTGASIFQKGAPQQPVAPFTLAGSQTTPSIFVPQGTAVVLKPSADAAGYAFVNRPNRARSNIPFYKDAPLFLGPYEQDVTIDLQLKGGSLSGQSMTGDQVVAARSANGAVVHGDSVAAQNNRAIAITLVDNGNGTATISAADMRVYPGDLITVNGSPVPIQNQTRTPVLSVTYTGTAPNVTVTSATYALDPNGVYSTRPASGGMLMFYEWHEHNYGFASEMRALTEARFDVLGNFAAGGQTSTEMLNTLDAALALGPAALLGQIGTNDVYATITRTPAEIIANLKEIFDRCVAARVKPMFGAIIPRRDSYDADKAKRTAIVNTWMESYLKQIGGTFGQNWTKSVSGTTFAVLNSTLGQATATFMRDDAHPAMLGAISMGKALLSGARNVYSSSFSPTISPINAAANNKTYFGNPLLLVAASIPGVSVGSATAGTGTLTANPVVPDGVSVTNAGGAQTITVSVVPRTEAQDGDAAGNWLRIKVEGGNASSVVIVGIQFAPPANMTHADVIRAFVKYRSSGKTSDATTLVGAPVGFSVPALELLVNSATTGNDFSYACAELNPGAPVNEAENRALLTPPRVFKPGGATLHGNLGYVRMRVTLYGRAALAEGTFDICWPSVFGPVTLA